MKGDYSMQHSNQLMEQMPIMGGNTLSDKDREFNLVLEISSLTRLGDSCDDDRDSNSSYDEITKAKKSQNMTECVPVPSSEHVAEIVGRQGCKIKALRNKTNTYIKTPVRGEEPVFVVTGRKEDVAMARREVQSAAEHFTQIRASRSRHALLGQPGVDGEGAPGTITLQVRVPYRVVGLVVGPKGATIKRIQQQTHTYIVTPSREKEPVFEVTGLPENVEKAREEIEAHIAARTGTQHTSIDDDFKNNGTEVGSPSLNDFMRSGLSVPNPMLFKNSSAIPSAFIPYNNSSMLRSAAPSFFPSVSNPGVIPPDAVNGGQLSAVKQQMSMLSNLVTNNSTFTTPSYQSSNVPGFGSNGFQPVDNVKPAPHWSTGWSADTSNVCEASTAAPTFGYGGFSQPPTTCNSIGFRARSSSPASHGSSLSPTSSLGTFPHPRLSPTLSDHQLTGNNNAMDFPTISNYMPASNNFTSTSNLALTIESGYSSSGTNESAAASPVEPDPITQLLSQFTLDDPVKFQQCVLCNESRAVAALVPCGHNLFCYGCANNCVKQSAPKCPCCHQPASMALLIKK